MNNQLQSKPKFSLAIQSEGYKKLINNTLGDPKRSAKFIAAISSAVATNPGLQECDAGSILSGALLGEALNLSPSPQLGQYYLVPFDQKKYNEKTKKYEVISKKAQFQLGYKGYIQLAIRSGQYKDIDVIEVREGEYLGRNKITGKHQFEFIEDEVERENKPIIGYMAYFEYLNGFYKNLYWSKEKMQKHALEYSQAYASDVKKGTNYSFWSKDFDGMAFKTMLRQLISKWGIMSIDMQEALTKDMSVIKEDGTCDYVDNQPIVSVPTEEKINTEVAEPTEKITEVKQVNINEL
jgi:recombination protein RecT